jgi:hypothetical protein
MKNQDEKCVQCGRTRKDIKEREYFCATVTYEGETDYEWPRHRFRPYSEKELARQKADDDAYIRFMGGIADFVEAEDAITHQRKDI